MPTLSPVADPVDAAALLSSTDVGRLSGASPRQVDYWTRLGYLMPTGNPAPGSGCPRRYRPVEARIAWALVAVSAAVNGAGHGGPPVLRPASGALRGVASRCSWGGYLVLCGHRARVVDVASWDDLGPAAVLLDLAACPI